MKIIHTSNALSQHFIRLMKKYNRFYWAAAWAGRPDGVFQELCANANKIQKFAIGIHFYQTDPDFIDNFIDNKRVRFILAPDGTFHPKVYIFCNHQNDWEIIMGSANFTTGGFGKNIEANILISSKDVVSENVFNDLLAVVENGWNDGKYFTHSKLVSYKAVWQRQMRKLKSLSGNYSSNSAKTPPLEVGIMNANWASFIKEVERDGGHDINGRLKMLSISSKIWSKNASFRTFTSDERKFLAGLPNKLNDLDGDYWAYFGSMKGNGVFSSLINNNNKYISDALDEIPLKGQILKNHFESFVRIFNLSFEGTRLENANNIATATRLLCMKRPDVFICLDGKNKAPLCEKFQIIQAGLDYDRYWDDIIERIFDCEWWNNPQPRNEIERKISQARAAFLDSIYYVP